LEAVATLRANNGGQVRRLQYQMANVETQITNISAANGRIMDVDIAAESSNLARQQVLVQASAAMTAQANVANDVALMLLQ
jgi:flagellin